MKITVVGTGYVGLVTGTGLAEMGNEVLCLDLDESKIKILNEGRIPIHEPGLLELVKRNMLAGRLRFTTDIKESVKFGTLQFIAVGTPPDEDGSADLKYVLAAAKNIAHYMDSYKVIINKSTVPVGTADNVSAIIQEELVKRNEVIPFAVVSNPEFLKEGAAIEDFMRPDRVIIGSKDEKAISLMRELYAPFIRNHDCIMVMDIKSAELTKYAANAMLATRISFMNELSNLADKVGADIEQVRVGIGSDPRIGFHFLYSGCGYGGSCFPKDVQALIQAAREHGSRMSILESVESVNETQKQILLKKIAAKFGEDLTGRTFALWGLAFKPNTDDMRAAPSRTIIEGLWRMGASIIAYDPVAIEEAQRIFGHDPRLTYASSPNDVLKGSDALIVVTEWKEFRVPNFELIKKSLKTPVIFDGRNLYNPTQVKSHGIEYYGIGRLATS